MSSTSISSQHHDRDDDDDDNQNKVNGSSTVQIAMVRLEDEFRNILIGHTAPIETNWFVDSGSSTHSEASRTETATDFEDEDEDRDDDDDVSKHCLRRRNALSYRSMSSIREIDLIPPEAITDLQAIAKRMVEICCGCESFGIGSNGLKSGQMG
ncbi:hypothetical protein CFOL_v3_23939 [Cephalotus follicularis]|uniref:Uncharacterized protein n=1 Tax=Cephalotus follicularis TaxID=3775 RepID=A0A1Q3CK66_CEPFO|nr:hypothetical protein CFOL_v3_23939 [Cephalotus follicularis]